MTTPIAPDIPAPSTFGPPLRNFGEIEDPETDMDSGAWNLLRVQVAAMASTQAKAIVTFGIDSGFVSVLHHTAQWGAAPGVAPSVVRVGPGVYDVTWASSYTDLRDDGAAEPHPWTIRSVTVSCDLDVYPQSISYRRTSATSVRVTLWNPVDATEDALEVTVVVW